MIRTITTDANSKVVIGDEGRASFPLFICDADAIKGYNNKFDVKALDDVESPVEVPGTSEKVKELGAVAEGLSAVVDKQKAEIEALQIDVDGLAHGIDLSRAEVDAAKAATDKAQKDLALIKAENFTLKAEVAEKNDAIEKLKEGKAGKAGAKPKKTA